MYALEEIRSKESNIPKYLESLTWSKHVWEITKKITAGISALQRLRHFANRDILVSVYNALIMPHFDYCCEVWYSLGSALAERLQKLHNRCARVIMPCKNEAGQSELALCHLGWSLLRELIEFKLRRDKCVRFSMIWYLRGFRIFSGTQARLRIII